MSKFIFPVLTAGVAAFVAYSGYCVYHHAKNENLVKSCSYEMFESNSQDSKSNPREVQKGNKKSDPSELNTPFERRNYFMQKIKGANASIESGNQEEGIKQLIEAMSVCSRPATLLQCMSNTLPIDIYKKLIEKLSSIS